MIAARVEAERERHTAHAESLDGKAGILLGFAGVVVALRGGGRASWIGIAGLLLTALAALFAVLAFAPRPFAVLEVRHLRDRYLRADARFTRLTLVDTEIEMIELVRRKARLLLTSLVLLLGGVACIAGGILINELREVLNG